MTRFAAILCAASLLAGCASDPLRDVPRLSDADVSHAALQAAIRAEPEEAPVANDAPAGGGFLGRLFGNQNATPADQPANSDTTQAEIASTETVSPPSAAGSEPRGGLLGFLQRAADEARAEPDGTVEVAAMPQDTATDAPRTGLFGGGGNGPRQGDPDFQIVPLGTTLPYGVLARVCNVRPRQLGTRVDRYPEGRGMYALYDSNPGNTAPHTFYVTGFKDNCARQFTAALAVFGSTETHEQLRYGLPAQVQPYSQTDAAYERLKSRICRVGRGKPCGSALPRLSRNTVFVSVYERFGSNPVWKTILIHDGEVVETDIRGN